MLYPRFYPADDGEGGSSWAAYAPLPYRRLGFLVMGPNGLIQVIARMKNPPESFPNRSDVLVIGKTAKMDVRGKDIEYIDPELIILKSRPPLVCTKSSNAFLLCK